MLPSLQHQLHLNDKCTYLSSFSLASLNAPQWRFERANVDRPSSPWSKKRVRIGLELENWSNYGGRRINVRQRWEYLPLTKFSSRLNTIIRNRMSSLVHNSVPVRFVILYLAFSQSTKSNIFSVVSLFIEALALRYIALRQFLLLFKVFLAREKSKVAIGWTKFQISWLNASSWLSIDHQWEFLAVWELNNGVMTIIIYGWQVSIQHKSSFNAKLLWLAEQMSWFTMAVFTVYLITPAFITFLCLSMQCSFARQAISKAARPLILQLRSRFILLNSY